MIICGKTLGQKRPLFPDWSIPIPPHSDKGDGDRPTLGDLIEKIVREQVRQFLNRQRDNQFIIALSRSQIEESAEKGKIKMGGAETPVQNVDEDQAVATAFQAFEDGIYLVVIDDVRMERLEQEVFLTDDSRITFIRLAMLTGA